MKRRAMRPSPPFDARPTLRTLPPYAAMTIALALLTLVAVAIVLLAA